MKKLNMQTIARMTAIPALCFALLLSSPATAQAEVYYEKIEQEVLGRGITYEARKSVTDKGLLDVFVLKVPLSDPYITVKPVQSTKGNQLKEATSVILQDNGAIAGVNGDFFNMSGTSSPVIGPIVTDGSVRALDRFNNMEKDEYAALFLGKDGNPFIDYVKYEICFTNDGVENIKVFAINKITDMVYSVLVDHQFMADTSEVDKQFPGLAKIVVENGVITRVTQKGELVTVPENGYVILISEASADYFTTLVKVGQKADVSIRSKVDINAVQNAIGGAGKLLSAGQVASDGGHIITGAQPRTAVGFTQDKSTLIIMVVDGRTHSIGVTHSQLADLMLKYGAYNAMHLDGGGSSTMGIKKMGETQINVVNTPSGGSQRKVANALGVFTDAPIGPPLALTIKPQTKWCFKGTGMPLNIYYNDANLNMVPVDPAQIALAFSDEGAKYENGYFYPSVAGNISISGFYSDLRAQIDVGSKELMLLIPSVNNIKAGVGGKTDISFTGKSKDGFNNYIYMGVDCQVVPPGIGHMEGTTFVADDYGAGYIKCSVGDVVSYIDVNVGFQTVALTGFEDAPPVSFTSYPEGAGVTGNAKITPEVFSEGAKAVEMNYALVQSDQTQAAYLKFDKPIQLKDGTMSFKLSVFGDNSYYWLRAKLIDGDGKEQTVDLAKEINWVGWKDVTATLPSGIKQPVSLDRIYVTSLANIDTNSYKLYFDNLICDALINHKKLDHPANAFFKDPMEMDLSAPPAEGFDITITGKIAIDITPDDKNKKPKTLPGNYNEAQQRVIAAAKKNSARVLFNGFSDIREDIGVKYFNWNKDYSVRDHDNVLILPLTAKDGGFASTDAAQWARFPKDVVNPNKNIVIIETDLSPLHFTYAKESDLFQDIMENLIEGGKTVFVVSTEGTSDWVNVKNGVRYINVGGLWNKDDTVNDKARILRLRLTADGTAAYAFQGLK